MEYGRLWYGMVRYNEGGDRSGKLFLWQGAFNRILGSFVRVPDMLPHIMPE